MPETATLGHYLANKHQPFSPNMISRQVKRVQILKDLLKKLRRHYVNKKSTERVLSFPLKKTMPKGQPSSTRGKTSRTMWINIQLKDS